MKHVPYLDGWRGLAIVLVLQSHFLLGGAGRLGVCLFFALSGYLMGELLFVKEVRLGTFFERRINRIVPTFWLYVVVAFFLAVWFQARPYRVPADELMSTLFFARTYLPAHESIFAEKWPIGHFWSLNVEEHSYIYLAVLALIARRSRASMRVWLLVGSTVICLLFNFYYALQAPGDGSPWFVRSEYAALGLIASATLRVAHHHTGSMLIRGRTAWITPVSLALAVICFGFSGSYPMLTMTLGSLLLAVSLNYLSVSHQWLRDFLSAKILRWFGICSFSLYVWQQIFFIAYERGVLQRQIAGLMAIGVGISMFYLYENPVRRYLNGESRAKKSTGPILPAVPDPLDISPFEIRD